ncbi:facilitated trehalose transporter Tret1-2 homolog [Bacillus rossius redtenbacheri]|uniref:facilitated trehalose transporter Tret1-2 homolog n=1 Tax=Bacillus rossius redtenbacheri TaxID=93214 RepID=UPI002FDD2953
MAEHRVPEEAKPWLEGSEKLEGGEIVCEKETSKLQDANGPTTEGEDKPKISRQIAASVAAGFFHLVAGLTLAFSASLVPQLDRGEGDLRIGKQDSPWLVSAVVLVVPVGAMAAGLLMEAAGRLNTLRVAALPAAVGWVVIATGQSYVALLVGRVLTGISMGMGTSSGIVYITEVASPSYRGSLISVCPSLVSLGMLVSYAQGYLLSWRTAAWAAAGVSALSALVVTGCVPESPLWLVSRGRADEAERALRWFAARQSRFPQHQLAAMIRSQDLKSQEDKRLLQRLQGFLRPTGYKPLTILVGLFFFQQFSGIYCTQFYAVNFFEDVGSGIDPSLATVFMGVVRIAMSFFSSYLLKRFGRRPLCITSSLCMAASLIVSGIFTWKIFYEGAQGVSWVPVVGVLLYVLASMSGMLNIPWTLTAEMFPSEIRSLGHGAVVSSGHLLMFAAIQTYLGLQALLGGAAQLQWFYAGAAVVGAVYVYLFLPETRDKKLADIQPCFETSWLYDSHARSASQANGLV